MLHLTAFNFRNEMQIKLTPYAAAEAGGVSTWRSRPSAVSQPANKLKKIPFETQLLPLPLPFQLHRLPLACITSPRRSSSAGSVKCKLNRTALEVNFTCISVAISACGSYCTSPRLQCCWHLAPNYLYSTLTAATGWSPAAPFTEIIPTLLVSILRLVY